MNIDSLWIPHEIFPTIFTLCGIKHVTKFRVDKKTDKLVRDFLSKNIESSYESKDAYEFFFGIKYALKYHNISIESTKQILQHFVEIIPKLPNKTVRIRYVKSMYKVILHTDILQSSASLYRASLGKLLEIYASENINLEKYIEKVLLKGKAYQDTSLEIIIKFMQFANNKVIIYEGSYVYSNDELDHKKFVAYLFRIGSLIFV